MSFNTTLYIHFVTNFSFYTLKSFLILYLTKQMGIETQEALLFFGNIMGMSYFLTLWISSLSDKYLTPVLSILIGISCLIFGFLSIPLLSNTLKPLGFAFICCAAGFYKPAILAEISKPRDNKPDKATTRFYGVTNLSGITSGIIAGSCIGLMGVTGTFFLLAGLLIHPLYTVCSLVSKEMLSLNVLKAIGITVLMIGGVAVSFQNPVLLKTALPFLLFATFGYMFREKALRQKSILTALAAFTAFAVFAEIFWGATTLYIEHHIHREMFGFNIPTPYFHSINPILVVIFTGLGIFLFKKRKQAPSPARFINCFVFLFISVFALLLTTVVPIFLQLPFLFLMILFQTWAELIIVPKTLDVLGHSASENNRQKTMSLWLGCIAGAHILASHLSGFFLNVAATPEKMEFTTFYSVLCGISLLMICSALATCVFQKIPKRTEEKLLFTNLI